eukprot:XP_017455897.1 PREDICTED: probable ATP-dependent RNA helicase DDX60 [Rattus norvegicus]
MEKRCTMFLEIMSQLILENIPRAAYSSLLNDFVESEFFLIDGDSLLLTCVCEMSLEPGQSLHFFYLVERYLLDVTSKGGQFAIVFFKDAEYAYFSVPELLTLRTSLILHLQKNTTIEVWTMFSNCLSEEWSICLNQSCPYFLIVADEGLDHLQTHLLNFVVIQAWAAKVNVVLFSGQTSDILRLYAYFMQSSYTNQMFFKKNEETIMNVYKALIEQLEKYRDRALTPLFGDLKFNDMEKEVIELEKILLIGQYGDRTCSAFGVGSEFCSWGMPVLAAAAANREDSAPRSFRELRPPGVQMANEETIMNVYKALIEQLEKYRDRALTPLFGDLKFNDMEKESPSLHFSAPNLYFLQKPDNCLTLKDVEDFCKLHCLSVAFQLHLPLSQRARSRFITSNWIQDLETVLKMKKWCEYFTLSNVDIFEFWKSGMCRFEYDSGNSTIRRFREMLLRNHRNFIQIFSFFSDKRDPRYLRGLQKYHYFQRFYGSSLESITSKTIITEGPKPKKDCIKSKRTKAHKTKAEIIVRENKKRLIAEEEQKEGQKWSALSFSIEEEMRRNLNSGIKKLEEFLKSCKSSSVKTQAERVGLQACLKAWKEHCRAEGKTTKDFNIAVNMMKRIHSLLEKQSEFLQEADQKLIARCLTYLGFYELADSLCPTQDTADDVKMTKKKYSVGIGPARFQLQYMGHYLIREERKDPDPRVQDFIPDTWQRELLDVVDNYESAVIVAPTSSGKTYASYYCMEKVLKESNEGVVVYVAPTKVGMWQMYYSSSCSWERVVEPAGVIVSFMIEKYGFPSDLALSPRESIQLYDTMCQVWKSWPQAQNLCPENFTQFKNKIVIKKLDARKYEESLKEEFTNWVKNGNEKEVISTIILYYFLELYCSINHTISYDSFNICSFASRFSLDTVEECAENVCEFLEEKQEEKRPPKADKEAYIMANKLRKVKKSLEKQKIDEKGQKSSRRLDQSIMYEAEHNYLLKSLEKNLEIPKDCTYADQKAIDEETLQIVFGRVKCGKKGDTLKKLARRGIGYHHRSMTAKEKQLVEILFRKGFIRVVTATGTLALGINMPCKSVVFAQNSVYLDALNYRQMSGRAGRRGQDLLGDVYFFDIPLPKIGKLIKSKVPELRGQFPLSITLILRLMLLATKADDLEDGKAKALSVLKHSLLSFKQPRATDMLKLYFLYSLQFLVKEGHIDQEGNPTGFAGLVTHLNYHEPSNLVFVSFLVKGLFHKLCQPTSKDSKCFSEDVMEKLVLVLANLFGRIYIPAKFYEVNTKFYQSKVNIF